MKYSVMKYIILKITEKDIRNGERRMPGYCPIALALRERFDQPQSFPSTIKVHYPYILIGEKKYFHSEKSHEFMKAFDEGEQVSPTRLRLYILPETD